MLYSVEPSHAIQTALSLGLLSANGVRGLIHSSCAAWHHGSRPTVPWRPVLVHLAKHPGQYTGQLVRRSHVAVPGNTLGRHGRNGTSCSLTHTRPLGANHDRHQIFYLVHRPLFPHWIPEPGYFPHTGIELFIACLHWSAGLLFLYDMQRHGEAQHVDWWTYVLVGVRGQTRL